MSANNGNTFLGIGEINLITSDSGGTFYTNGRSYIARILSSGGVPYSVESLNMTVQSGTLYVEKLIVTGNRFIVDFGTVVNNNRYVDDFPDIGFTTKAEDWDVKAEIFQNSIWSGSSFILSGGGYGTVAHSNLEGIVIQTGGVAVVTSVAQDSGKGHGAGGGSLTSAPCRVIATYVGKAKNA